jgi:hypothetical protein
MNLYIALMLATPVLNFIYGPWVGINLLYKLLLSRDLVATLFGLILGAIWFFFFSVISYVAIFVGRLPPVAIAIHFILSLLILTLVDSACIRAGITPLKDEQYQGGRKTTFFFWFRR